MRGVEGGYSALVTWFVLLLVLAATELLRRAAPQSREVEGLCEGENDHPTGSAVTWTTCSPHED